MTVTTSDIWLILIAAMAYGIGSFPTAFYVTKGIIRKDIRSAGSGNIGAMNCYRLIKDEKSTMLGITGFLLVLLGDMGKGVLVIFIARCFEFDFLGYGLLPAFIACGFFVVLGHNYSIFFRGKSGGRGISSLGGVLLGISPLALLVGLGTLLFSIFVFHYLLVGRINWGRFGDVFSVVGSQVLGRFIGLALALVPLYFFGPMVFFPALAADVLVLIKHIERVMAFVRGLSK